MSNFNYILQRFVKLSIVTGVIYSSCQVLTILYNSQWHYTPLNWNIVTYQQSSQQLQIQPDPILHVRRTDWEKHKVLLTDGTPKEQILNKNLNCLSFWIPFQLSLPQSTLYIQSTYIALHKMWLILNINFQMMINLSWLWINITWFIVLGDSSFRKSVQINYVSIYKYLISLQKTKNT